MQNSIKFVNYSVIDQELLNKIIYDVGKVTKSPSHLEWSFSPAQLVGSNKLRAYLFFIYARTFSTEKYVH